MVIKSEDISTVTAVSNCESSNDSILDELSQTQKSTSE